MSKESKARSFFNAFTGATGRHNKALRDICDWAETVLQFLNNYDLYDGQSLERLLAEPGDAKFDLTGLAYNGRPLVKQAADIRETDITPMVQQMISSLEGIRRYLINPKLQEQRLQDAADNLVASYEKLREALSQTEPM
jgi:hypothetical protein